LRFLQGLPFVGRNKASDLRAPDFEPTEQEQGLIDQFGNDHTPFRDVMTELANSGLLVERQRGVRDLILDQRLANRGPQGKERSG